jgi:hypothetical protein
MAFDHEFLTCLAKAEFADFLVYTIVQTQNPMTPPFFCAVTCATVANLTEGRSLDLV